MRRKVLYYILFAVFLSCKKPEKPTFIIDGSSANGHNYIMLATPDSGGFVTSISPRNTTPQELLAFANSLKGIPYKYASTDPLKGFDCSGFIAYVFNHFDIAVPRSSVDFTFVQRQIRLKDAKPGDLILFTGADSCVRKPGHMGIISSAGGDSIRFIHSSSGKHPGVTETTFKGYYVSRYLKTIRVFGQNNR